jgi:hypothetical protein
MAGIKKGGLRISQAAFFPFLCDDAQTHALFLFTKRTVPGPNQLTIRQLSDKN